MARELGQIAIPKSALALDSDEVNLHMIKNHLETSGVDRLVVTSDPREAWDQIQGNLFEMLILDWELPEFPGVKLFNKIRGLPQFAATPIMLLSSRSYPKEFKLFQEYPLSMLVEKPLTKQKFERRVNDLLREQQYLISNESQIEAILDHGGEMSGRSVKDLTELIAKAPNPAPIAFLAGQKLIEAEQFAEAERIYRFLLKSDQQSILAMSGLAKALLRQEKHDEAAEALKFAQKHSPKNLDRLHLLGEVELKENKLSGAKDWFEKALEIDPESSTAQAGITVASNIDLFRKGTPGEEIPQNFASLLNLIGISLVKSGKFKEGISQYASALNFVNTSDDRAKLCFNAGLGALRAKNKTTALHWFQKSVEQNPKNFHKSRDYVKRLQEDPEVKSGKTAAPPDHLEPEEL